MYIILSTANCPNCDTVAGYLDANDVPYERRYVSKQQLYDLTHKGFYPQVMHNDVLIEDIIDHIENDWEPLLYPTNNRFTIFPIKYPKLWELYKKAQMSNWIAEEVDLSADMADWESLSKNEKYFVKHILAFFASSDGIVFENLSINFSKEVQIAEARSFYAYQEHNEMVHGETYSLLIDKYIIDPKEKEEALSAITTIPCIKEKAGWAMKWFDATKPFRQRLIAFVCVEGIFFSGSFCAIFWLKKRGLLPGLAFSNELISRDEGLHCDFAIELFNMLNHKSSRDEVLQIIESAVQIEKQFIVSALPCKLIGMDAEKMSTYIEYVADRLLKQMGFNPHWNAVNPFDFMETQSLDGKTNFFEKRVGDYSKFSGEGEIEFDADF